MDVIGGSQKLMNITIIGGGNIGTLMAAEFAHRGHRVTVYTSGSALWKKEICVYNSSGELLRKGELFKVTDSMQEAVEYADYIWITMPAQLFHKLSEKMQPYVRRGQRIGVVPGGGGAEFGFYGLIKKGCILFGLQRVHSIARLKEYGSAVYELGRKPKLQIGAIPAQETEHICADVNDMFGIPCVALDNYLCVTLTPSNPILHTTRLYSMFRDYRPGMYYPRNFLFYEEWTDEASGMLIACDEELQKLCEAIPLKLSSVKSLKSHYESQTPEAMTRKIRGLTAFKGLTSPMRETQKGWIPDWESRYFATDFPYGLKIIRDMSVLFGIPTPNIDIVWGWYEKAVSQDIEDVLPSELTADIFLKLYQGSRS